MPTFKFTGPDGKQYTVNGPDGATEQQAFQMLQTQLGQQQGEAASETPRAEGGSTVVDGIKGAAAGAGLGFANIVLGAQRLAGKGLVALDDKVSQTTLSSLVTGKKPKGMIGRAGDWLVNDADAGKARLALENAPYKEASPLMNMVGEVGGAMVVPAGRLLPGALRTASTTKGVVGILPRAGQAAATGAAYGGVAGATGSNADTFGGMLADGASGAAVGATLGGVSSPVAAGIGAVSRNVGQRVSQTKAADFAREKIAEALARDARGTLATGGYTNPLYQAAARFKRLGPEAVLADAGGRNTNQLLDTLVTLPGRTKEKAFNVLHERTAGVGDRMRAAAEDALNTQGQRLPSTVDSLINRRQLDSAPLYNQLRQIDIQPSQQLADIVKAADELGATKLGREIATARQMPFTLDAAQPSRWNMGDLDHVKQGIDQVLASRKAMNTDGTLTPIGHAYQALKTKLVGALDDATTNQQTGASLYREARAAFATPSALIDAANAGRSAITRDEANIMKMVKGMSDNELQAFRIGAYEGLHAKLGTQGGQTNIMNMWKEPATQEKLQAIFGNERSYRQFASSVSKEAQLKRLQSVGAGSQTAARQAGMGDLDMSALKDAGAAFGAAKTGNLLGAVGAGQNAWSRVAVPQQVRDQMGSMLLSRGVEGGATLNSLADLVGMVNTRNLLLSNRAGMVSGGASGNMLSNMLQPPPQKLQPPPQQ